MAESMIRTIDESTIEATNISLFHILTLGSIGASLALFFAGKSKRESSSVSGRRLFRRSKPLPTRTRIRASNQFASSVKAERRA
jgi:hypothetical protein